jgi:hypothetical protein
MWTHLPALISALLGGAFLYPSIYLPIHNPRPLRHHAPRVCLRDFTANDTLTGALEVI